MKNETRIKGVVLTPDGKHFHKEDRIDMEIHDAIDYLVLKYITKGSKWTAVPAKFVTEMSREEERINREKSL